jgi:hypothetical protein
MTDAKKPEDNPGHGKPPQTYQVVIDKLHVVFSDPNPSGRELLQAAKMLPVEGFAIYIKQPGAQPKRIQLDERVDLTQPGVERFVTLPLDQTEGLTQGRRHFSLPAEDMEWLEGCGRPFELVTENGVMRVVVYDFPLPAGYTTDSVTVHIQVPAGYPDVQLDMVWFSPGLSLSSGKGIGATSSENFDGKSWQRWSRHRTTANPWRPGIDSLGTHFALIEEWLLRETRK